MTNVQPTYDSGTVKLEHKDGYLVSIETGDASYSVHDNTYQHTWITNGKTKRMLRKYKQPVVLRYYPYLNRQYASDYRVEVVTRTGGKAIFESSFESINSLITHYQVRHDLIDSMVSILKR